MQIYTPIRSQERPKSSNSLTRKFTVLTDPGKYIEDLSSLRTLARSFKLFLDMIPDKGSWGSLYISLKILEDFYQGLFSRKVRSAMHRIQNKTAKSSSCKNI